MNEEYIFWNIDTQKDFFDGSYKIPGTKNILNNLNDITQYAKTNNIKVINSAGWYNEDANHFSENPDYTETFPVHCKMNSDGAKFIKETQPEKFTIVDWANSGVWLADVHKYREVAITKGKPNLFDGNAYAESVLHNLGIPIKQRPKFIIYGINIGDTALSLLRRGYEITVVNDANMNFNGEPFRQDNIIQEAQNPYPDQVQIKQNVSLKTITTQDLLKGNV